MDRKYNKALVVNAKRLRKNMTREESRLWYDFLREYPVKFVRQKMLGRYILDFYCASAKLAVELDGSQHYEDEGLKYDSERTAYLEQYGIEVLRIANNELNRNFEGACAYIDETVKRKIKGLQEL